MAVPEPSQLLPEDLEAGGVALKLDTLNGAVSGWLGMGLLGGRGTAGRAAGCCWAAFPSQGRPHCEAARL